MLVKMVVILTVRRGSPPNNHGKKLLAIRALKEKIRGRKIETYDSVIAWLGNFGTLEF